jgi:hypothetical protein
MFQRFLHLTLPNKEVPIIIFDQKDDDILLLSAMSWQYASNTPNPRIVEYHPDMGLSIPIYDLASILGIKYERLSN